jgi:hypothetical protein
LGILAPVSGDDDLEAAEQITGELFAEAVIFEATGERPAPSVAARTYRMARKLSEEWAADFGEDYATDYKAMIEAGRDSLHARAPSDPYWAEVLRLLSDDPWWCDPSDAGP